MQRIAPETFTLNDASNISIEDSSTTPLPPIPALFTSTSMWLVDRAMSAKPWATDSDDATSISMTSIVSPRSLAAARSFVALSSDRTVPNTW